MDYNELLLKYGELNTLDLLAGRSYMKRCRCLDPDNLVGLWPGGELAGIVAADVGPNALHGTNTGVELGGPGIADELNQPAYLDSAINAYINVYSSALSSAWSGTAFTVHLRAQTSYYPPASPPVSVYLLDFYKDAGNYVRIWYGPGSKIVAYINSGGVGKVVTHWSGPTGEISLDIVKNAAGEMKFFIDGVQTGSTQTGLGAWVAGLTTAYIGRTSGGNYWGPGYVSELAVWDTELSQPQISAIDADPGAILATAAANLKGYWPLIDGSLADVSGHLPDAGNYGAAWNFDYTEGPSTFYDGVNDYTVLPHAELTNHFDGSEGTALLWFRVLNDDVWSNGLYHYPLWIHQDWSNYVRFTKMNTANSFRFEYVAGGTTKTVFNYSASSSDWVCAALTWSADADQMIAYWNRVQLGTIQTGLGTWGSNPLVLATLGCYDWTPSGSWLGWMAYRALWKRVLTPPEIDFLSEATS